MKHLSPFNKRLTHSFFADFDGAFDNFLQTPQLGEANFQPRTDIEEHKNHYLLSLDLPGVEDNDINIDVDGDRLTITGERKKEHQSEDENGYKRYERFYGNFMRSFSLPNAIDSDQIDANFESGVLHILIPKRGETNKSKVTVKAGEKEGLLARLIGK